MKLIPLLAVIVLLAGGCNNGRIQELEQQNQAAQNMNHQLTQDLAARDEYVDKVTSAINDVYTSIEDVKAKEKSLLRETTDLEAEKKLTREEVRAKMLDRITLIRSTLQDDHKRITALQAKIGSSAKKYAGLQKMVDNLKKTIEERDLAIADLGKRVDGLQHEITEKGAVITQQDSVIRTQYKTITTAYYIAGTRDELEKMGIITKEGGFLWGLLGSTTTLTSKFDEKYFKPINKTVDNTIQVNGKIDEILPRRNITDYQQTLLSSDQSMLTIAQPEEFWKDKYLVIITDRPSSN